jgi:ethanolamine permease
MDIYYGTGFVGVFKGVFTSAWWFTGFECLAHGIKETITPKKDIPFSLVVSCIILGSCALFLTYFNVLVPPGAGVIASSPYPMVDVIAAKAGEDWRKTAILIMFPSLIVNISGMLWCASRQGWALSRVGYYPHMFSISSKDGIPRRAAIAMAAESYVFVLFALWYRRVHGDDMANELFLETTLVCAMISYAIIAITYIGFTMYFPDAPRPFKNPLGNVGAGFVFFVSSTTVFVKIATSSVSRYSLLFWFVYILLVGIYFIGFRRMHLVPTEDAVLTGFFKTFKYRPSFHEWA